MSGLSNITMLAAKTNPLLSSLNAPEQEVKAKNTNKEYRIANIKMNIVDIKHVEQATTNTFEHILSKPKKEKRSLTLRSTVRNEPKPSKVDELRKNTHSPVIVDGMTSSAFNTSFAQQNDMTKHELGVSDKKIIIPSFGTTSKLFTQHMQILRDLKFRVGMMTRASNDQRSRDQSWEQIQEIQNVIQKALYFLDFPDDQEYNQQVVRDSGEQQIAELPSPGLYDYQKSARDSQVTMN